MMKLMEGNIVDVHNREIFNGSVEVKDGRIVAINRHPTAASNSYILPGFVDAHVHIESSMLTPENFGNLVVQQGMVAVVTDPHEVAGVVSAEFMIENSRKSPIKTFTRNKIRGGSLFCVKPS